MFRFRVIIPHDYPHNPPKVLYDLKANEHKIFHPNIDEDGKVCLNILRAEWRPVLTLKSVVFGMELLFSEPNPDDPLNKKVRGTAQNHNMCFHHPLSLSHTGSEGASRGPAYLRADSQGLDVWKLHFLRIQTRTQSLNFLPPSPPPTLLPTHPAFPSTPQQHKPP